MQRSKHSARRLLLASAATALVLVGCEAQQASKEPAANSNGTVTGDQSSTANATVPTEVDPAKAEKREQEGSSTASSALMQTEAGAAAAPQPAYPTIIINQAVPSAEHDAMAFASPPVPGEGENYAAIEESTIKQVAEAPISTFSIDVDTGAYANVRRFLMNGQLPPKDAVRVEEMINYFTYDYPAPADSAQPFRVSTAVERTPWNADTYLLHVGIKGYVPPAGERPPANLVFLVDVSGSMAAADKLPLLRSGMKLLADQLRDDDKVSIVVYAGAAGLVLEPTGGKDKAKIKAALDNLAAGGSTAGGEGLQLAYAMAKQGMIDGGINRVILATDGDFNVGVTDTDQLKAMIEDARDSDVSLTTLGFGEGNYNDALMEQIADVGNGNYGYVDSIKEAKRLLIDQLSGTIQTIAKDVKIQIEFNPDVVAEYRLIGYENRALNREDFNNDQKDAGEIGAGHSVTAIYEIALKGSKGLRVDPLRYGGGASDGQPDPKAGEFAFLRLRYKAPDGDVSKLIETPLSVAALREPGEAPSDARFAVAVAAFGQKLRGGDYLGEFGFDQIAETARSSRGEDEDGYRAEFIELVEIAQALKSGR
jgi:Ca-activated chloride channel family protein